MRSEHTLPFALGGNTEIKNASCRDCEAVTSYLDGYLARHIFYQHRVHASIQTRRPKERPDRLPAKFVFDGETSTHDLAIPNHPYFLALPVWRLPGILMGLAPDDVAFEKRCHAYGYSPKNLREAMGLPAEVPITHQAAGTINFDTFARAIAKIAYCHAVLVFGLDGFRPLVLPDLILGKYPHTPHFVGCETGDPPPPTPEDLHKIGFHDIRLDRFRIVLASVRLFANAGHKQHGFPIYRVVVGARRANSQQA